MYLNIHIYAYIYAYIYQLHVTSRVKATVMHDTTRIILYKR